MTDAAKVLPFKPRGDAKEAIRAGTLEMLEEMIARVKDGEVDAVAVLFAVKGGGAGTDWRGWSGHLITPAAVISARLVEDMRETSA